MQGIYKYIFKYYSGVSRLILQRFAKNINDDDDDDNLQALKIFWA